jgi:hypothetical protein
LVSDYVIGCDGIQYNPYKRIAVSYMRPYIPGEDLEGVSVSEQDKPELGGMIAVNKYDIHDRWYVAKKYFQDNYKEAE